MTGGGHDETCDTGGARRPAPRETCDTGGARRPAPRNLHRGVQGAADDGVAERRRRRGGWGSLPPGHMGKIDCTIHRIYTGTQPVRRHTHNSAILPFTLLVLPNSRHHRVFRFSASVYDGAAPTLAHKKKERSPFQGWDTNAVNWALTAEGAP